MENEEFQEVVLQQFKKISETLVSLSEGQKRLDSRLDGLDSQLENVEKGQTELVSRMQNVEKGQTELVSRMQNVEKGQTELASRLQNVEKGQLRIETRLENEVIEKIRALFDARQVHLDYFESLKDGQANIEEGLEILRRRTTEHKFKLMAHDRELRLLRTEKK